ncbi:MAG TPA: SUMF1/EgtB/PvdO family nonheme iron enzyme [Thermoguttaceae bacterium]|nr:SUMF1/EgtB/PvdO family nonheme iron enzyme [Thermoguttaceae bacterium]
MTSPSESMPYGSRVLMAVLLSCAWMAAGICPWLPEPARAEPPVESPPVAEPAGSFLIPAWAFNRGNAKTFTTSWADAGPMVANGGVLPNVVEYDITFPVPATYVPNVYYAAQDPRPVDLYLDEQRLGSICRTATGSWNTSGAAWEESSTIWIAPGKHTIKLERNGPFPHLVSLRFDSSEPFPKSWKLVRPKARKLDSPPPVFAQLGYNPTDVKAEALRRAIRDLIETFGEDYPKGPEHLKRLEALEKEVERLEDEAAQGVVEAQDEAERVSDALRALRGEALLANPLLDFDRLLLVKRGEKSPSLGLPRNWQSNSSLPKTGFDDEIAVLSPVGAEGELSTLFKPDGGRFAGDVDLHFDADRLLFSMPGSHDRWQVFEIGLDGSGLSELTGEQPDVDSYDACYLPDGKILFTSTACFIGVPCVYGGSHVSTLYVMDADGKNIRQLCFDQEHDWCPTVMNNGRVLYSRWEYTDTPHSNTRLLFHMNPDGTEQMEYYGSNSYWPNSIFYARPVPHHPTKVVAVIGGHHDNPRMGELVLFDPAKGRREATGAVQRIPGHGKPVEMIIRDGLTLSSWPKFLHPYPLSDKHFLVAARPTPQSLWGIYLVDVFDNMVLVKELPGYAMLEPIPIKKTPRPPVIPDKVQPGRKDALVYLPDVYRGDGLKGIPRGTVKKLRLVTYHFAYQGMGGLLGIIGMDGPWDIKRVVGTVPVYEDGSARFRIPANVPIALQPLDEEGKALQLMRSWMTAMPGEVVQCAGCHEPQNSAPPAGLTLALDHPPDEIEPWYGPLRGFSYPREVQPVVDRYCVGCHNGQPRPDGRQIADLRGNARISDWKIITSGNGGNRGGKFSVGYAELHRYVRRPGIESDYHMLTPMEYHADTTQLVEMLQKGHHGVELDAEAWDRLITWIDLNCPYHGTWGEELADPGVQRERRRELLKLYANLDDDPEAVPPTSNEPIEPIFPKPVDPPPPQVVECPNWPFDAAEAQRRQAAAGPVTTRTIDLGDGVTFEMTLIPAGEFVMGSVDGAVDERPLARVEIEKPIWMGVGEVTNAQFARFDPNHDSRVESKNAYQFGIHGYPMNEPEQPVVRVSWNAATGFCRWLSRETGDEFTLPTEAQWEYACRAGTAAPMFYGGLDTDFSPFANVCDAKMVEFVTNPYTVFEAYKDPPKYDDWIPKDARFNDGSLLTVAPGTYQPNAWGLFDVHGNVAEWTRTAYRPFPYYADDGRDDPATEGRKVVRGGSWRDRPKRCTSSFRLSYQPYQRVYNVGFRVIAKPKPATVAVSIPHDDSAR